jgi:mRNA interferase RelE/StbE
LTWKIEWDERARKELRKLDATAQKEILRYLQERIRGEDDPRRFGKPLRHELQGLWRYRVGTYRMLCRIEDDRLVVLVLAVGHRSAVYQ